MVVPPLPPGEVAPELEPVAVVELFAAVEEPDPVAGVDDPGAVATLEPEPVVALPPPEDVVPPAVAGLPLEDVAAWAEDPPVEPQDVGVPDAGEPAAGAAGVLPPALPVGAAVPEVEV